MTKRKLTKQQQWRIQKVQQERGKRSAQQQVLTQQSLNSGELGEDEPGLIIAHYGQQLDVQPLRSDSSGTSQPHRCYLRSNIDALVTGDQVVWRAGADNTGVIVARKPRQSILKRPDKFGQLKPVAANIDLILIVIAPEPQPFANLINRYLVAAETVNINACIVLNKKDLINESNRKTLDALSNIYRQLDYPWLEVSSNSKHGLQPLIELLAQGTSIFVGQSGVGKSSLINALLPNENLRVGDLSAAEKKGMHTTTAAKLYNVPTGGALIDSPGIREFGLWHIDEQTLAEGFIEFRPFLGHCRFRDCQHRQEPGCALMTAVEQGLITKERIDSYFHLRDSLSDQQIFNTD